MQEKQIYANIHGVVVKVKAYWPEGHQFNSGKDLLKVFSYTFNYSSLEIVQENQTDQILNSMV